MTRENDKAVGLLYDGTGAPRILASGRGRTAAEIIAIARENDVVLQENTGLVDALIDLPLGEEVPEALYVAVAEVLSFAYMLSGKSPPSRSPPPPQTKQAGDIEPKQ